MPPSITGKLGRCRVLSFRLAMGLLAIGLVSCDDSPSSPPPQVATPPKAAATKPAKEAAPVVWYEVLEVDADPRVVTNAALRGAIKKTGLPWRVRDRKTGIEMLLVPPGEFVMGKSPGDADAMDERELPTRKVRLTKPFYLGRYEVTQGQYSGAGSDGREFAVGNIAWPDAAGFCSRNGLRLPTEAEWEFACRAGVAQARYGAVDAVAWHKGNSGGKPHAIGSKAANALGFFDMLGGQSELVNDRFGKYTGGQATDPTGPSAGTTWVMRGGSWNVNVGSCRASVRGQHWDFETGDDLGFRAARNP